MNSTARDKMRQIVADKHGYVLGVVYSLVASKDRSASVLCNGETYAVELENAAGTSYHFPFGTEAEAREHADAELARCGYCGGQTFPFKFKAFFLAGEQ